MELKMELAQKQTLNQHMVQSMEILQMSVLELEEYIENLSMENPVVDLAETTEDSSSVSQDDLQRKLDWLESSDYQNRVYYQADRCAQNSSGTWQDREATEETLADYVLSQLLLHHFSHKDQIIIEFLAQSLDSRGYFTESLADTASYFSCSEAHILALLREIQKLDPAGVGARSLSECLLLQLERLGVTEGLTIRLVEHHLEDIAKNHQKILSRKLGVSLPEILSACQQIRQLNPKPGNSFSSRQQLRYISPDAVVVKLEEHFEILINEYQYPRFDINTYYKSLFQTTQDPETRRYLQEKIQQAEWIQTCITQRSSTLSRVLHSIVKHQESFFLHGPGHKSPMQLADLSIELGLHESTISRSMRGKYLQCSWGIYPLNYFLTLAITKSTASPEEITAEKARATIQELIQTEDKHKPYSDQALCDKLEELGIPISRRTVNKYRTEMGIPDRSGRKE